MIDTVSYQKMEGKIMKKVLKKGLTNGRKYDKMPP